MTQVEHNARVAREFAMLSVSSGVIGERYPAVASAMFRRGLELEVGAFWADGDDALSGPPAIRMNAYNDLNRLQVEANILARGLVSK